MKSWARRMILVAATLLGVNQVWAGSFPAIDLMTEMMMENQGENNLVIGAFFGPDPNSALVFTSMVDPVALTFSFSLNPGSTYLGLPISLSSSASFDAVNDVWDASSSVTLGTASWTIIGTYSAPIGDPFQNSNFLIDPKNLPPGVDPRQFHDMHDLIFYNTKDGTSGGFVHFTNIQGQRSSPNFPVGDVRNPDGSWSYELITDAFWVHGSGFSPVPTGGSGTFTTMVSPIPEPSFAVLVAVTLIATAKSAALRSRRS